MILIFHLLELAILRRGTTPSLTLINRSSTSEEVRTLLIAFAVCIVFLIKMNAATMMIMKKMIPTI